MSVPSAKRLNEQFATAKTSMIHVVGNVDQKAHQENLTTDRCAVQKVQFSNEKLPDFIQALDKFFSKHSWKARIANHDNQHVILLDNIFNQAAYPNRTDLPIDPSCNLYISIKALTEQIIDAPVTAFRLAIKRDCDLKSITNGFLGQKPRHGIVVVNLSKNVDHNDYPFGVALIPEGCDGNDFRKIQPGKDVALFATFYALSAGDIEDLNQGETCYALAPDGIERIVLNRAQNRDASGSA